MADEVKFQLPSKIDAYLATLSRMYRAKNKTLEEEVVVNGKVTIEEGIDHDNWDGGIDGHGIRFSVSDSIFIRLIDGRESIQDEIKSDLNKINTVKQEFVSSVSIEIRLEEDPDWRSKSPAFRPSVSAPAVSARDLERIWGKEPVRVFLSHKSSVKVETSQVKQALAGFGLAAFVAHEDIEPTEEWHREIERALFSMDVLVALLTADYHNSNWTDQEVGVAVGRGVPIVAVRLGMDPYGLMGKHQGLGGCKLSDPSDLAAKVFGVLQKRLPNKDQLFESALALYSRSRSFYESGVNAEKLFTGFDTLPQPQIDKLLKAYAENIENRLSFRGRDVLIPLLRRWTGKTWVLKGELLVPEEPTASENRF